MRTPYQCAFLILLLCSCRVYSQNSAISGYVQSCKGQESLVGALISFDNNKTYFETNKEGYFHASQLDLPDSMEVSYLGFKSYKTWLEEEDSGLLEICLSANAGLPLITVKEKREDLQETRHVVSLQRMQEMPALGGEVDLMKSLTLLPGVSQGNEGTSDIYVRGGEADQNLVLLDGIRVYNLNHLGGYFSLINDRAVKQVRFYKGDIPAQYGNRLSSLIDITLKDGAKDSLSGKFELGTISSKLLLEVPLKRKKSGLMIAGRSSYLGLINLFREKETSYNYLDYWLYDIYVKYHAKVGKGRFSLSYFTGLDAFTNYNNGKYYSNNLNEYTNVENSLRWGNDILSMKYSAPLLNNLFFNTTLGYSQYKTNQNTINTTIEIIDGEETESSTEMREYDFLLRSYIGKMGLKYYPTSFLTLNAGARLSINKSTLGNELRSESLDYHSISPYLEAKFRLSQTLQLRTGVHLHNSNTSAGSNWTFSPRINARYALRDDLKLFAGINHNFQYLKRISFGNYGLIYDIFIPNDRNLPATSWEFQLGAEYKSSFGNIKVAAYYKKMKQLQEFPYIDELLFTTEGWQDEIIHGGRGKAKGLELDYEYVEKKLNLYFAYNLAFSDRTFSGLNRGKTYASDFDRRHTIQLNGQYRLSKKWQFSGSFILRTGRPVSFPTERIPRPDGDGTLIIASEKNNLRLPPYHRMDIGISYTKETKRGNQRIWAFSIYNLYNRKNPNEVYISSEPVFQDDEFHHLNYYPELRSYFSIIPSIHFSYEF